VQSILTSRPGRVGTVSRYRPGQHQPRHTDAYSRVSLVLAGALREETRRASLRLGPGDVLLKSCRVEHEDTFGAEGALVLSLAFDGDDPFDAAELQWRRAEGASGLAVAMLETALAGDGAALETVACDLLAARPNGEALRRPPAWLLHLRDELEQLGLAQVDVAQRARAAGVHAAHASRLFRRCFGTSITTHAQANAVRRALGLMARPGAALGEVALAAGFYDQSHMSRVFRRVSGRAPGAYRSLLRRAAATFG
jgi:AraC-like DNA-binding protein